MQFIAICNACFYRPGSGNQMSQLNFVIQACICFQHLNLGSAESQQLWLLGARRFLPQHGGEAVAFCVVLTGRHDIIIPEL